SVPRARFNDSVGLSDGHGPAVPGPLRRGTSGTRRFAAPSETATVGNGNSTAVAKGPGPDIPSSSEDLALHQLHNLVGQQVAVHHRDLEDPHIVPTADVLQ